MSLESIFDIGDTLKQIKWFLGLSFQERSTLMNNIKTRKSGDAQILQLLTLGRDLWLDDADGTLFLTSPDAPASREIVLNYNWSGGKYNVPTEATRVEVYQIRRSDRTLTCGQAFNAVGRDVDKMSFTEHQINKFCKKFPDWLAQKGASTFFLLDSGNEVVVADISQYYDSTKGNGRTTDLKLTINSILHGEDCAVGSNRLVVRKR